MKLICHFIIFFACLSTGYSQSCESIQLRSQDDVDNFMETFGDCTEYTYLNINGYNITNLSSMSEMQAFDGNLTIQNTSLTSLAGLVLADNLIAANIRSNNTLTDLVAFESVSSLEYDLFVQYNNSLSTLNDLVNIAVLSGITINSNSQLVDLEGLSGIEEVDRVSIFSNQNLADCCGVLSNIRDKIDEVDFSIGRNSERCSTPQEFFSNCDVRGCFTPTISLRSQDEVDNFEDIYGDCDQNINLFISGGDITDLTPLHEFEGIQDLTVSNTSLTDLRGLSFGESLSSLSIESNNLLTDLSALSGVVSIDNRLSISRNGRLENVNAFSNLNTVGSLNIYQNNLLQNIDGFEGIDDLPGQITISRNESLLSCCSLSTHFEDKLESRYNLSISGNQGACRELHVALNSCGLEGCFIDNIVLETQEEVDEFKEVYGMCTSIDRLTINGISIVNLAALNEIEEISNLTIENTSIVELSNLPISESTQYIIISSNDLLVGLESFDGLRTLGQVNISNNASLTQIDDLRRLQNINRLTINNNTRLEDIDGLLNLRTFNRLDIYDNASLSECCSVIRSFEDSVTDKNISIRNNDDGCKDLQDLLLTCEFEGCYSDVITITEQSQIDNFVSEFGNCTDIQSLYINGANINNLEGLSQLQSIASNLRIQNTSIESLQGLDSLRFPVYVTIENNPLLSNIAALTNIDVNIQSINISNNSTLSSCCVLGALIEAHPYAYNFTIRGNDEGCAGIGDILTTCGIDACIAPDVLRITSQSDIDNFRSTYGNCTSFTELNITGRDITNFDGLADIEVITQSVSIWESSFESLEGLEHINLDSISNLNVTGTGLLSSLDGLSLPRTIDRVNIGNLPDLTDLRNLRTVKYVSNFVLSNLPLIEDLQGLQNLSKVENISINNIAKIKHLDELSNIIESFNLNIYRNNSLENIDGLVNVRKLENIDINSNDSLSACCVLLPFFDPNSSHRFNFYRNASGCADTRDVLNSCGYDGCLGDNVVFETQEDVDNVRSVYGNCPEIRVLRISGNSITNLDSLIHIGKVNSQVVVESTSLESLEGLSHINFDDLDNLTISDNGSLLNLTGLDSINAIGQIVIRSNNNLKDLIGLNNLQNTDRISINDNEVLESLNGLEGLRNVSQVHINRNPVLTDIEAIASLESVTAFYILGNNSLQTCCTSLKNENGQDHNFYGIDNNADGCNNLQEIRTSCALGDCSNGNITLSSQEEVDNFSTNNPGCQSILSLTITGEDITNLDSLIYLEFISESLSITETSIIDLETISHLDVSAVTQFRFIDNPDLNAITSLSLGESIDTMIVLGNESITSIGSQGYTDYANYIQINRNESLIEVPFFETIRNADQVSIYDNINLNECCGLFDLIDRSDINSLTLENNSSSCNSTQRIVELCGYCDDHGIRLSTQAEVDSYRSTYPSCTEIDDLIIEGTDITNLDSLYYLQTIHIHNLTIENTSLINLDGISHVVIDVDFVEIINNPLLESINLNDLSVRDDLIIRDNGSLRDLDGISGIGDARFIEIAGNASLENIDGLSNVGFTDEIFITDNVSLINIDGIRHILDDGSISEVTIHGNSSLSDCCILEEYFEFEHPHEEIDFDISANGGGCNSQEEIVSSCNLPPCEIVDLVLTTQEEVDSFPSTYPSCTIISTLTIEGEDITSLDSLYIITEVGGPINIIGTSIEYLAGIRGINYVEDLLIADNPELRTIRGLPYVTIIHGSLTIRNNDALTNLSGMEEINEISELSIIDNDQLINIDFFSGIRNINEFNLSDNASLFNCCTIEDIIRTGIDLNKVRVENNLEGCTSVMEARESCICPNDRINLRSQSEIDSFRIIYPNCNTIEHLGITGSDVEVNSLAPLNGIEVTSSISIGNTDILSLDGITIGSVLDYLTLRDNPSLTNIDILKPLVRSNLSFWVSNIGITNMNALENLKYANSIQLFENFELVDISGLGNLDSLNQLGIGSNINLSNCCIVSSRLVELPNLVNISVRDNAEGCNGIEDIVAECAESNCGVETVFLESQVEVDSFLSNYGSCDFINSLVISGDDITSLESMEGMLEFSGELNISHTSLESLDGLSIAPVLEAIYVFNNPNLFDLSAFSPILISNNIVLIEENNDLQNLDDLSNLQRTDILVVRNNSNVSSLEGLASLAQVGNLRLTNNEILSNCCAVLNGIESTTSINDISGNSTGCNSLTEIMISCDLDVVDPETRSCETTRITLMSQSDVDNFAQDYPSCQEIEKLFIAGTDIDNLDGLSSLISVSTTLIIEETSLADLAELGNVDLSSLSELEIVNNQNLTNLSGLNISGEFDRVIVSENPRLTNIDNLEPLRSYEYLEIYGNENLSACCPLIMALQYTDGRMVVRQNAVGCNGFKEIEETCDNPPMVDCSEIILNSQADVDSFSITYSGCISTEIIHIVGDDISNLDGLASLENVKTELLIGETQLESLEGLDHISFESLRLVDIYENPRLLSLDGLNLSSYTRVFSIFKNEILEDLSALMTLNSSDNIEIVANSSLQDLTGLERLNRVEYLVIYDNSNLTNIDALHNVSYIEEIEVYRNESLSDCCILLPTIQLDNVSYYIIENAEGCLSGQEIEETCMDTLSTACAEIVLNSQEEVDNFTRDHDGCNETQVLIIRGRDIDDLSGLISLLRVTESIEIEGTSLLDLEGLSHIDMGSISKLEIRDNDLLDNLNSLFLPSNMERVIVSDNSGLLNIESLEPLRSYEYLEVFGNTNLSGCCPILLALEFNDGRMVVRNNADGCTSPNEIKEICELGENICDDHLNISSQAEVDAFATTYPNCTSVEVLDISGTDITDLGGLLHLDEVTEALVITGTSIVSPGELEGIDLSGVDNVKIFENSNLINLAGINVSGEILTLEISDNPNLNDLSALSQLNSVGSIILNNNESITSLDGLNNLVGIQSLEIVENQNLQNLDALLNAGQSEFVSVHSNSQLSDCCGILASISDATVGSVEIYDNLSGCNSADEVVIDCDPNLIDCAEVILTNQAEVDNFAVAYPDCRSIGELHISGLDITNLTGLASLVSVSNILVIDETALTNLMGLENVDLSQLSELEIIRNPVIENLLGLEISADMDRVLVSQNFLLTNVENLEPLRTYEYLEIFGNPMLSECCPIVEALAYSAGRKVVRNNDAGCNRPSNIQDGCDGIIVIDCSNITISNQEEVDNFSQTYPGCTSIEFLDITGQDITNLDGLASIENVTTDFLLRQTALTDLSGLSNISFQTGEPLIGIVDNDSLTTLDGINFTGTITTVEIDDNDALVDLSALVSLEEVDIFGLYDNRSITNLAGLEGIDAIADLLIDNNASLVDISALENVDVNTAFIFSNTALTECCITSAFGNVELMDNGVGCSSIDEVESACSVSNSDCPLFVELTSQAEVDSFTQDYPNCSELFALSIVGQDIVNLDGLSGVTSVSVRLIVEETSLLDLSGLESIDLAGISNLQIIHNQELQNLSGLNIASQIERVIIYDNLLLTDITNLESLRTYEYLEVFANPSLSVCCAIVPALEYVDGRMVVRNNAVGCNGPRVIIENCKEGFHNQDKSFRQFVLDYSEQVSHNILNKKQLEVYPNPFENSLLIKSDASVEGATIKLFDIRGALVLTDKIRASEKRINTSELGAGIYLLRIEGAEFLETIKLFKR